MARKGGFGGGMPGNMNNLLKQAQRMQRQMEEQQKEMETREFTASAGGGAVRPGGHQAGRGPGPSAACGGSAADGAVAGHPGDAAVTEYAEKLWATYTNKLEAIMTAKWTHFGVIQPTQAWTDIRRTGYPALTYPEDEQAQSVKTLPNRIKYPSTEAANNAANYKAACAVQADELSTKLFWEK